MFDGCVRELLTTGPAMNWVWGRTRIKKVIRPAWTSPSPADEDVEHRGAWGAHPTEFPLEREEDDRDWA